MQLAEITESMTVVDLGSGSGYFLCWLSRAVGERGHVVATEVDKALVRALKKRVENEHLPNVEVVLAPTTDVGVAPATADRILLVNVWHHIANRPRYAARVARALSPGGKVVIVDFKPGARPGGHGIQPERVLTELAAGGIDATVVDDELTDQFVIIGSVHARG
jgi:arsenite methyltransferase